MNIIDVFNPSDGKLRAEVLPLDHSHILANVHLLLPPVLKGNGMEL